MKLKELLESFGRDNDFTFIIAKAVKDESSPLYHYEYRTTPVRTVWEWLESNCVDTYIVIKRDASPIDITGAWNNWYNKGRLKCCIVTTEEDLRTKYSESQANDMIEFYDKEVRK